MGLTKAQLEALNVASFPNNNEGLITPTILRNYNSASIANTVNQDTYTTDSASFNQRINQLDPSGSAASFNALNAFTASQLIINTEYNAFTQSADNRLDNLEATTSSLNSSVTQLNQFSASQLIKDTTLENVTASLQQQLTNIGSQSASWDNTSLNTFSASQLTKDATLATYTGSNDTKWSTLGSQSGSWITESETSSFAYINKSNAWSANQTFTNISAVSASFTYVQTLYETSSVIYSSGSNQFGDAAGDVQTLYGSTRIINELTASGLRYPTTDGTFTGQVLQTDAAGTLSFGNVVGMYQTVHNGEATSLTVGTAVYVSGSQGANPIVYRADASNASKMPVQYIISETITSGQNGRALLLGVLEGYNVGAAAAGTLFYVDGNGTLTSTRPTGSSDLVQPIAIVTKTGPGGQLSVLNPGPVLLPNIQTGYTWVGNGNNQPTIVATSSFIDAIPLTSLNAFTASQNTKNSTLATYTASVDAKFATIGGLTGSYATTGSNTFTGQQTINFSGTGNNGAISIIGNATQVETDMYVDGGNYDTFNVLVSANNGVQLRDYNVTSNIASPFISVATDAGELTLHRNTNISGNLDIQSTLTASLQQGYVWVGNANGKTITVATSSIAGVLPAGLLSSSVTNFTNYSQSVDTRINNIVTGTGFATTGSNTFTGQQNIVGTGQMTLFPNNININTVSTSNTQASTVIYGTTGSNATFTLGVYDDPNFNVDVENSIVVDSTGILFSDFDNGNTYNYVPYLSIAPNTGNNPKPNFTRGLVVKNSLTISGSTEFSGNITFKDRSGNDGNVYLGSNAFGMGVAGPQTAAVGNTISVAIGNGAMRYASGSNQNVAIGNNALLHTTGSKNFALGSEALSSNTLGSENIAIGVSALTNNVLGASNVVVGNSAGFYTSGSFNTFIGDYAGYNITGSYNTIIGRYQGTSGQSINNNIVISDGQGNVQANYSGSAWSLQGEIKLNKGSNKPSDIVTVSSGGTTIYNSLVTGASVILLTTQNGLVSDSIYPAVVSSKTNGSFLIRHQYGGDLQVAYLIINPTT